MLSIISLLLLVSMAQSQMAPMCASSSTNPPCTVTFTQIATPQTGPTSTVWAAMMTTMLNVIDCRYCQINNVPYNQAQQGPFTTKVSSPMMTVTQVGCMPETTAITRRNFRGYPSSSTNEKMATTQAKSQPVHTHTHTKTPTQAGHSHLNLAKRQNLTNPIGESGLSPEAQELVLEITTAIYCIDLVNIASNLSATCQDLQASANSTQGFAIGVNLTQAADIICTASVANVTHVDPSIIQVFAAALYAVELAGNFTGTTNTTTFCASIDLDILTLPYFGVNGLAVQSYVCNANNVTMTTTFSTSTIAVTVPSAGTITPFPWSNQTMPGTGTGTDTGMSTGTGAITGAVTGTGSGTWPFGTGPGVTGTGTGVSGWPYGNRTMFPTASGSGYAQPSGTGGSGDPMSINFPPFYDPSSLRLPPNPTTTRFYPAVASSSGSAPVYGGYGYGYAR